MQDIPFENRLHRRDVLRLIAAGTGVSVLMVAGSAPALAATSRAAKAGAINQLNIAWNAAPSHSGC